MQDLKGILNAILGADMANTVQNTLQQAVQGAQGAASGAVSSVQSSLEGTQAGAAMNRATQVASENPGATMAAVGGLAALLLGTAAGRSVAGGALKVGSLAALGGLAYKAFTNYQEGKPLTAGVPGLESLTAPASSGFHADDHTDDTSSIILRAMVATAAADGVVDPSERATILKDMSEAGIHGDTTAFLNEAISHPASVSDIAAAVGARPQLAAQVYAASSLVASANSPQEQGFLASLATALGLSNELTAHIRQVMAGAAA